MFDEEFASGVFVLETSLKTHFCLLFYCDLKQWRRGNTSPAELLKAATTFSQTQLQKLPHITMQKLFSS